MGTSSTYVYKGSGLKLCLSFPCSTHKLTGQPLVYLGLKLGEGSANFFTPLLLFKTTQFVAGSYLSM